QQKELLQQYHAANILLIECLGRESIINAQVRTNIENKLSRI
ncbi:MAG: NACHT C-terminal helical domain 2-containing protein, partial [Microcystaceae cyanobacterium]